jgi:membrane associated rhomboid family serine protease
VATLALVALNIVSFASQTVDAPFGAMWPSPFQHANTAQLIVGILFLWLFGDNVEARLGRTAFVLIYLAAGWSVGLGAAGGVSGVIGAYFTLLPRSRVLILVPLPLSLVEAPAAFFLALWCLLQAISVMLTPARLWALGAALLMGAAIALVTRRRVMW